MLTMMNIKARMLENIANDKIIFKDFNQSRLA
jgi:hypothetical protein